MVIMRLQFREFEDDMVIYVLSFDELDVVSVQNINDKFLVQFLLFSIKGKFCYLKVGFLFCCYYWLREVIKCMYK